MTNIAAARELIGRLREHGVSEICVCAGSRNSPLLAVLGTSNELRLFSFIDERSAAFFALGRIKLHGASVAVVTTSGTAAAELFPAAIEAHYAGLPLVLITADRPARYRGTGAPQAIEQEGLFGVYAATSLDAWSQRGALHLNIEFDEPLIDAPLANEQPPIQLVANAPAPAVASCTSGSFEVGSRPLVLLGGLAPADRARVRDFALRLNAPVYAEPLSGLREDVALGALLLRNERVLARGAFTCVIRIGNVPTLRFWRDLDEKLLDLPLLNYSALPFVGLSRGVVQSLDELPADPEPRQRDEALFALDRDLLAKLERILDDEPTSELAMLRERTRSLSSAARVYLGNSLPIREFDMVAPRDTNQRIVEANRGANGIDGQLATFFGQCDPTRPNVAIVGDLTALYDLNAPWIVPQLDPAVRFQIVVVNNGGGRIFSRVASLNPIGREMRERIIENTHALRFEHWAAMWGLGYNDAGAARGVEELLPDEQASQRVWQRYDELWR